MTVPMAMLICVTPPAMMPGTPSVIKRRMLSVIRGQRSFRFRPARFMPHIRSAS